jgi:hypothetical protein
MYFTVFRAVTSCGDGIDVPERSMLLEVEGSTFFRSEGTLSAILHSVTVPKTITLISR